MAAGDKRKSSGKPQKLSQEFVASDSDDSSSDEKPAVKVRRALEARASRAILGLQLMASLRRAAESKEGGQARCQEGEGQG